MLNADRNTPSRGGIDHADPVAAGTVIRAGALTALNANGFLVPGSTAVGLTSRGRALETVDNSNGLDGDQTAHTDKGTFRFNNHDTDVITRADIGGTAYIVDDETVAVNDGTGTRSVAGKIDDIDDHGVWVTV
jgi:hypothetical protein